MPLLSVYGIPIQYIQLKTKLKSTSAATLSGTTPTGGKKLKKNHKEKINHYSHLVQRYMSYSNTSITRCSSM